MTNKVTQYCVEVDFSEEIAEFGDANIERVLRIANLWDLVYKAVDQTAKGEVITKDQPERFSVLEFRNVLKFAIHTGMVELLKRLEDQSNFGLDLAGMNWCEPRLTIYFNAIPITSL